MQHTKCIEGLDTRRNETMLNYARFNIRGWETIHWGSQQNTVQPRWFSIELQRMNFKLSIGFKYRIHVIKIVVNYDTWYKCIFWPKPRVALSLNQNRIFPFYSLNTCSYTQYYCSTFPKMVILNQQYPVIKLLLGKQKLWQKLGFLDQNFRL